MDILWKHTIQRANYYYWFGDQAGGRTGSIHRDMSKKWLQSGEGGGESDHKTMVTKKCSQPH